MSDDRYSIRWKGKILGPYTRREIERRIQEQELGMLHEVWNGGHWITLREFLGPKESPGTKKTSQKSVKPDPHLVEDSSEPAPASSVPPSPWLMSGYLSAFVLLLLGMLGWTDTWIAPWGWAPLLGLGLGLIGGLFGLLTLFHGERKHGFTIIALSLVLAFGNMMLA